MSKITNAVIPKIYAGNKKEIKKELRKPSYEDVTGFVIHF